MTLADKLRPYVKSLLEDAAKGNENAKQVIATYQLHNAQPMDPAAPALCECFFDDWLKEHSK